MSHYMGRKKFKNITIKFTFNRLGLRPFKFYRLKIWRTRRQELYFMSMFTQFFCSFVTFIKRALFITIIEFCSNSGINIFSRQVLNTLLLMLALIMHTQLVNLQLSQRYYICTGSFCILILSSITTIFYN